MNNSAFGVLVVATGDERLKNDLHGGFKPKALWPILDKPMVGYLLKAILECDPEGVSVTVKREDDALSEYLESFPSVRQIKLDLPEYCEWRIIRFAGEWLQQFSHVLVIGCDLPFLGVETIRSFVRGHVSSGADCSFLGDAPYALAFNPHRLINAIDSAPESRFSNLMELTEAAGLKTQNFALGIDEAPGIHNQTDLAGAVTRMRDSIVHKWMGEGVHVMDPCAVWIGPDAKLEPGVTLMPGVQIWGNSFVGEGSAVGPYCILRNAVLGRGVNLAANVIVEDSELRDYVKAGPFAYIRESSVLKERSLAGKFVELKKTLVGSGSKVPHLSYMGDATLGENVNIGAGSVTCNYDGVDKFQTRIGDRCFVGSDTMLVAPVTLGDDSITGAGSIITADVPPGALALGRARQQNLEDWALKKKKRMEKQ